MLGMEAHLPLVKDVLFLWTTAGSFIFLPVLCLLFCSCRNDAYQLGEKRPKKKRKAKSSHFHSNSQIPFLPSCYHPGTKDP